MAEHNVVLSHNEIKNELHAISENKGTAKTADLKFSLQRESLKAFQEQIVKFRNGDVNGEFAPRDVSYNECAKAYYGVDFTVVNKALGIKSNAQSFRQVGEKFGVKIDNFSDLLKITSNYSANSLFGSAAPLATSSIDSSLHWIIPETILQYIRLGIDSVSKSKSWLAGSTSIKTQMVTQPYVKPADANPTIIAEGEAIPMGTIEFGQRNVTVYKVGTGIKITSELQADSNIDIIAIFLQEVGNNVARSIDKAAFLTIVNGEQTDGSNAAPVIGVATSGTLVTTDIDTVMTRMDIAYQKPNVILYGETMSNIDLNETKPQRDLLKIAAHAEEAKCDLLPYVPANQAVMLRKEKCLLELNYRNMVMESVYDAATQTTRYFVSRWVGHQKLKDDSAVILDKSKSISTFGFPASMDYAKLYSGFQN